MISWVKAKAEGNGRFEGCMRNSFEPQVTVSWTVTTCFVKVKIYVV